MYCVNVGTEMYRNPIYQNNKDNNEKGNNKSNTDDRVKMIVKGYHYW